MSFQFLYIKISESLRMFSQYYHLIGLAMNRSIEFESKYFDFCCCANYAADRNASEALLLRFLEY